jgi:GPH family glycoside/pentoside/hexuronide:cation symporter
MSQPTVEDGLRRSTLVLYSAPAIVGGFSGAWISMYLLKFSTDVLLIGPSVVGLLLGISRAWDGVSDPLAGYLSDRTRSRFGRRRPWMGASAVPLALLFFALWSPPAALSGSSLVAWVGVSLVLFYTAHAAFNIPHSALGAELALGYHERTRLFGYRASLEMLGVFLAAGAIFALERAADERSAAAWIAGAAGVASAGLILYSSSRLVERPGFQERGAQRAYAAFRDVLANRHARLLLAVFFLDMLGFAMLTTLLVYVTEYVMDMRGLTGVFMAGSLVAMLAALPLWIRLSQSIGKRSTWIVTTLTKAAAFGGLFFVGPGDWPAMVVATCVIGATHGAGMVLGPSIKADVIDYDEVQTGQRKEGTYFASWNLAQKAASSFAIVLAGVVLDVAGFEPNRAQDASAQLAIRGLFAAGPCLFNALAALLLLRFSLDERAHSAIRATLAERPASEAQG